jgi:hypothetical protein
VFACDDIFDAVDRRRVAFGSETRAPLAVQPLEVEESIVERIHEVRRGHTGHAAANRAIVEDDDRFPNLGKEISSSKAGDAGADYTDVGRCV